MSDGVRLWHNDFYECCLFHLSDGLDLVVRTRDSQLVRVSEYYPHGSKGDMLGYALERSERWRERYAGIDDR